MTSPLYPRGPVIDQPIVKYRPIWLNPRAGPAPLVVPIPFSRLPAQKKYRVWANGSLLSPYSRAQRAWYKEI